MTTMAETSSSSSSSSSSNSSGDGRGSVGAADPVNRGQRDLMTDPKNMKEMLDDLSSRFRNFDDPETYRGLVDEALSQNTANFAVRFGVDHSEIATNLKCDDMRTLLQSSVDKKNESIITWM